MSYTPIKGRDKEWRLQIKHGLSGNINNLLEDGIVAEPFLLTDTEQLGVLTTTSGEITQDITASHADVGGYVNLTVVDSSVFLVGDRVSICGSSQLSHNTMGEITDLPDSTHITTDIPYVGTTTMHGLIFAHSRYRLFTGI